MLNDDLLRVPEKYRDGPGRHALFQQLHCERVTEPVWMRILNVSILKTA